jgi:hypothetical protein
LLFCTAQQIGNEIRERPGPFETCLKVGYRTNKQSETSKRPNADETDTSRIFSSVREPLPDGSKNANLANNHAGLDAWTDRKPENGAPSEFGQEIGPSSTDRLAEYWEESVGPIPDFLDRTRPRLGPPAISSGPDDDLGDPA